MSENHLTRILGSFIVVFIRVYQACLSSFLGPCCRFHPSCSEYAVSAVKRHGPLKGSGLALMRLLRCHPWHPGGYDPVK
ncbi:MAG: membrane protein insertion efficiency factor YidD [Syntrophaceae bacterium]|nr:membrane protein insertion efficiency factor YidD [Syntrophaceae bacterium]